MTKECKRTNINQSALQTRYEDNQKRTKHSKNNFISLQEAKERASSQRGKYIAFTPLCHRFQLKGKRPQSLGVTNMRGAQVRADWGLGRLRFTQAIRLGKKSPQIHWKLQAALSKADRSTLTNRQDREHPGGWRQQPLLMLKGHPSAREAHHFGTARLTHLVQPLISWITSHKLHS